MAEEFGCLLDKLKDPLQQVIAVLKVANFTNGEIASKLNCSVRTVERQLCLIRKKWQKELR